MNPQLKIKLDAIYYSPDHYASYGSIENLFKAAKEAGMKASRKEIKNYLHSQPTYTRFRRTIWNFNRRNITSWAVDDLWSADLIFLESLAFYNSGHKYALTVVDNLSGYLFAEPLKKKTGEATATAFQAILDKSNRKPHKLITDYGGEFLAKPFQQTLSVNRVKHMLTASVKKAAVAERFNLSLKQKLFKHMAASNSWRWIDVLQRIVSSINKRKNRVTKMAPADVSKDDEAELIRRRYGTNQKPKLKKFGFHIGDYVRIQRDKTTFQRGFLPNYTNEVYQVSNRHDTTPHIYEVSDPNDDNTRLNQRYYSKQLIRVLEPDLSARFKDPPKKVFIR